MRCHFVGSSQAIRRRPINNLNKQFKEKNIARKSDAKMLRIEEDVWKEG